MDMSIPARRDVRHGATTENGVKSVQHPGNGRASGKPVKPKDPTVAINSLVHELRSCVTEADIVQVLYRGLSSFGYDVVVLQVLEREGWYHRIAVDTGVLQDVRRFPLAESAFRHFYMTPHPATTYIPAGRETWKKQHQSRGPGAGRMTRFSIWVPIEHRGSVIAGVVLQSFRNRKVPASELDFLEQVHRQLGVLVANASLNELTRNQARRLEALNVIARATSSSLDEMGILASLHGTLSELLPVDELRLVSVLESRADRARLYTVHSGAAPTMREVGMRSSAVGPARTTIAEGKSVVLHEPESALWVPIKERGTVRGALGITSSQPYEYEESTAAFLELVAEETALALRNAHSYEAIEDQRRRLELVNAISRRLASSLDRWSIMRTLREELASFLDFDGFILATITESADGPVAEGYQYVAGVEEVVPPVALAITGPSHEAYETGKPVLVRNSPFAAQFERSGLERERWTVGHGAAVFVSGPKEDQPHVSRSFIWVPVLSGDRITALMSLQSYHEEAFTEWHVQLLEDLAAHVNLALHNAGHFAQAQAERSRLEVLHVLELGVAGAADEHQLAEAIFSAVGRHIEASHMVLAYIDVAGDVVGFTGERDGPHGTLGPAPLANAPFFKRMVDTAATVVDVRTEGESDLAGPVGGYVFGKGPSHVVWVPVVQDDRVVGGIVALRTDGEHFVPDHVKLLEAAATVVGIALRTMRLHHANELALAQSVRIQELAALAGHELVSVVTNIADQARTMLEAAGVVSWAFDTEGRISATRGSGDASAEQVLALAGLNSEESWREAPSGVMSGVTNDKTWSLIPLWYGDRLVGAIGAVHATSHVAEPTTAALDFARHAAVAIENSRLVAETRGRIRTLEAVAAFTELDPTQPQRARAEMGRLVERALAASHGALWLLEDGSLVRRAPDGDELPTVPVPDSVELLRLLVSPSGSRRMRALLDLLGTPPDAFAIPIQVEGRLAGLLVARMTAGASETRRLAAVLAGQAAILIGQLELVDQLDRERRMMQAILRHSPVGVMLEDAAGRVVYANPEVEAIYRLPSAEMPGQTLAEIYASAGARQGDDDSYDGTAELRMLNPDRIVHVRRVEIPGLEGEPSGVLTLHEDVTAQRLALEAKDLMLRAIGHEVRSPAAAMKTTLAGMLQWDETIDAKGRRALLQEAYESSDRLLSLVESQLIIAKLETRHFEPHPEVVELKGTLDGVMNVLAHRYADRIDAVEISVPAFISRAYCEPTHLSMVLTNLIGNALEYTSSQVKMRARELPEGWLEITVADTGPGLAPGSINDVFEKTGPAGRNRSQGGLGLGLYLCRLVVERSFGGRIWVASSTRDGTTFKFTVRSAR
jgi:signal transduction histidine kinase